MRNISENTEKIFLNRRFKFGLGFFLIGGFLLMISLIPLLIMRSKMSKEDLQKNKLGTFLAFVSLFMMTLCLAGLVLVSKNLESDTAKEAKQKIKNILFCSKLRNKLDNELEIKTHLIE